MRVHTFLLCGLLLFTLGSGTGICKNASYQIPESLNSGLSASPLPKRLQSVSLYSPSVLKCKHCTQIYFGDDGTEVIVNMRKNEISHRSSSTDTFAGSNYNLNRPHAITYVPESEEYFICDTDNHRIIAIKSFNNSEITREISSIAGITLKRPHDIIYAGGFLFALNPYPPILFRFSPDNSNADILDLSDVIQYSRSLSAVDGRIYVSGSSVGKVVEIVNFSTKTYHVYNSPQKKKVAPAGTWLDTGLVINDIEKFRDFWYATSYFCPSAASDGADYNKNKFIRFKNWQDFENGNWQDLSHLLPDGVVPYYLTVKKDENHTPKGLAVAVFSHENPGTSDNIYLITRNSNKVTGAFLPIWAP